MATTSKTHGKYKGVIVSKTDFRKLNAELKQSRKDLTDFIVFRFQEIGEAAVKIAREMGSYHDITGNLRSSIGYIILVDGKVVTGGDFEAKAVAPGKRKVTRTKNGKTYETTITVGGSGEDGVKQGKALLEKLKSKFAWGIVLILCAGMEYAAFVENVKGKDVLTSAQHLAESLMNKLLKGIIK